MRRSRQAATQRRRPCLPRPPAQASLDQLTSPRSPFPQIERFVFRPGLSERAHYYAAITLNQLVLSARPSEGGGALAKALVEIYFRLFSLILEGKMGQAATLKRQMVCKPCAAPRRPRRHRRPGARLARLRPRPRAHPTLTRPPALPARAGGGQGR
jgi:hypothetical protein